MSIDGLSLIGRLVAGLLLGGLAVRQRARHQGGLRRLLPPAPQG